MFKKTLDFINSGVGTAYPCAAVAIGKKGKIFAREFFSVDEDTLFDLASLSKLVSTTAIALKFIENGKLSLDDNIGKFLDYTGNFADCKIKHLLTHTSGISAWLPLFNMQIETSDVIKTILDSEKSYETGSNVAYSCMGYIVLGKILEKVGKDTLDNLARDYVFSPLKMVNACYNPNENIPCAATEWYSGKVHDENAYALDGIAGNAGVFATLDDVILFAKMCSSEGENFISKELFNLAIKNHTPNCEEARGLGFKLEGNFFGHTGFTGTSLFVDKQTGLWGVLLTNAVAFGRENKGKYIDIRKQFYNMMITEYKEEK